ncbi:MAG: hypothetical protein J7500_06515 [Sphingomonas sp.]|uniref:hypothetical protein n=1 Tax=Sphingomonas sp. TaxID=28214 RepID=UPI001B1428E9|nr:hypothetical protein [Sphingomonas sp.]MBO9622349.1 hypothetical protein [Sphingomonas sp.]
MALSVELAQQHGHVAGEAEVVIKGLAQRTGDRIAGAGALDAISAGLCLGGGI